MNKQKILVVGSSGTVGSGVVKLLRAQGHEVLGTTSKKENVSSELAYLEVSSGEGLSAAFEGIDRAFLLSPPGYADMHQILSPLIQEAKRRRLKKVVLMTALGANASDTTPFRKAELELEKSGLVYNIVRPNWFMQNFATFWVKGIREQGKILLPAGQARTSFIDARDISAVIANLMVNDQHNQQAFDITGPQSLTHAEVAQEISRATGTPVVYEEITPQTLRGGLLGAGLPPDYTEFLLLILGFLREGYNAGVTDNVRKLTGQAPRDFAQYAKDNRSAWL